MDPAKCTPAVVYLFQSPDEIKNYTVIVCIWDAPG